MFIGLQLDFFLLGKKAAESVNCTNVQSKNDGGGIAVLQEPKKHYRLTHLFRLITIIIIRVVVFSDNEQ